MMKIRNFIALMVVCFLAILLITDASMAQGQIKEQPTQAPNQEGTKIKITGTIGYMDKAPKEEMVGYFVFGQQPAARFHVVNPSRAILDKLKQSGKTVSIEGYTTKQGIEFLFIEKIDGKKYSGGKDVIKKPMGDKQKRPSS